MWTRSVVEAADTPVFLANHQATSSSKVGNIPLFRINDLMDILSFDSACLHSS